MGRKRTKFNFSRTSFLRGMGSVLNIKGNYFLINFRRNKISDAEAIANDWQMVGQDMYNASEELNPLLK